MSDPQRVSITVNGTKCDVEAMPGRPLLEALREDLHLTGTHYGCGAGQCGACGVLIEGRREFSCQLQVADVAGKSVTTVEGLATGDALHPVQQAFLDGGGFQCGYCTPGMMIALIGILTEDPHADDAAVMSGMQNNLCRCCGYTKIHAACRRAAAAVREGKF